MARAPKDKATSTRRLGPENSATRIALLEAAEAVMCDEGYAAVTSRRVAEKAGVKQQLVYYYFLTMDDLLLATFRHSAARMLKGIEEVLASDRPLHGLLEFMSNPIRSNLSMEYMALGNHNEAIRKEIVEFTEQTRRMLFEAFSGRLTPSSPSSGISSPTLAIYLVHGLSQLLHLERALGMAAGHGEVGAYLQQLVDEFEPAAGREPRRQGVSLGLRRRSPRAAQTS